MSTPASCPCGSRLPFDDCCGPCLRGEYPAATAEALMRSRYVAHVVGDVDYLLASWDPQTRPSVLDMDGTIWTGLSIVRTAAGGAEDDRGVVEFIANCEVAGRAEQLHEVSRFRRCAGRWVYVDGEHRAPGGVDTKVGRNAPCPCGSGRKFKRCCGGA